MAYVAVDLVPTRCWSPKTVGHQLIVIIRREHKAVEKGLAQKIRVYEFEF
jgi:hypothetical protein